MISARTIVEVFDASNVLRDTETGLGFDAPPAGSLRFQTTKPVPVSIDSSAGGTNGVLYVANGWRIRVRYSDNNGSTTVVRESEAAIDCQSGLEVQLLSQLGRDTFFRLDGGCDDDPYLDFGETFGLTFQFYNQDGRELPDAEVELKVVDADTCTVNENDPCRNACAQASFIRIDNPIQKIGLLPALSFQQSTFSLAVVGTPPARKKVEFVLGMRSQKAGQGEKSCQTFRTLDAFQLLAQADDEVRNFTTDCQTGCTLNFDRNGDEKLENRIAPNPFDPFDFALRGQDETAIVYESLTSPQRSKPCTSPGVPPGCCQNCAANGALGGPWDFDTNREGFRTGISQTSKLSSTDADGCSNWGEDRNWNDSYDTGEDQSPGTPNVLDQNWGTGGGCGFMTGTGPTTGGVWHTGTIGPYNNNGGLACRPNDSICEEYDTNDGTQGTAFWVEFLRTPAIHPISQGPDAVDGYQWNTQITDWAWNMQLDLADDLYSGWTWNFDVDRNNTNEINTLGSEFIAFIDAGQYGLISGGQLNIFGGGHAFAPTEMRDGNPNEGDGVNGTRGNNRSGLRGCYFNDLNTIDLDGTSPGTQTAVFRESGDARPLDDDCDNDYSLGDKGCPGDCGVDDDVNGAIDDPLEICPCFRCVAGSPRAGKPCVDFKQCNAGNTTVYACALDVDTNGRPFPLGTGAQTDVCGDGTTDNTLAATFGSNTTLRQSRNWNIRRIASSGRVTGNIAYNTLEDIYGPAGDTWAGEVGFIVYEAQGNPQPINGYGMAIDDMVVEWKESHPVAQVGDKCSTGTNPDFLGQCATVSVGTLYVTDGDGSIPVTVIDPVPTDNLVNCDADPALELQVQAFSFAEPVPETFCLDPVGSAGVEFRGFVTTSSRSARPADKKVYVAYAANIAPSVTVRYFDKNDGKNVVSAGADGQPGVAGFDDDGDGSVDDADELCPQTTRLANGRTPHLPGTAARYSDDTCGCIDNPVAAVVSAFFDFADVRILNVFLKDGVAGQGTGDGDGFADPNEQFVVDVVVRNAANFPIENVKLTLQSSSPYIRDIRDNTILVGRLEKNGGGVPGQYDTCDTRLGRNQNNQASPVSGACPSTDRFVFTVVAPAGLSRASLEQELYSSFLINIQGLGKAEAGSDLTADVPILGSSLPQTFRVAHNLDKPTVTAAANVVETFETFARDKQYTATQSACGTTSSNKCLLNYFRPFSTGDQATELDGTHCQVQDPDNPNGTTTDPLDFCQLGAGYNISEKHWHLHAPGAAGVGVCENRACADGGRSVNVLSASTGRKSLSSSNILDAGTGVGADGLTTDYNRMNWVEWHRAGTPSGTANTFQLGFPDPAKTVTSPRLQGQFTGPELTFWTQVSIMDSRNFQGGGGIQDAIDWTYDAARVYVCVDLDLDGTGSVHPNGECDTKETGDLTGREKWEPLKAWYTPETSYRRVDSRACMYDPTDDGSTESDFFENSVIRGPSSTCSPNLSDSCVGRTRGDDPLQVVPVELGDGCFPETGVELQDGVKGLAGGTAVDSLWLLKRYRLDEYAGRSVLFRWHIAPGELLGLENGFDSLGIFSGNRDDGWFVDDIQVNGLADPLTLLVDNLGETVAPPAATVCTVGEINPALAAIPYPTFDPDTNKTRPAAACSDPAAATCDFDSNDTADTASDTTVSDAPLRPFQLTGITTPAATCVGGEIEYRFRDQFGAILSDWSVSPQTNAGNLIVTPAVSTDYFLDVRCSASPTVCLQTDSISIAFDLKVTFQSNTRLVWSGPGPFDTTKGNVSDIRPPCPGLCDGTPGNVPPGGIFSAATCIDNNGTDSQTDDTISPSPGTAFYYLVRLSNPAATLGTWNDKPDAQSFPSPGRQWKDRDLTLNACTP